MNNLGWIILQTLPDAIISVDTAHAIQFMNSAAINLFEVPDIDNVIGTSLNQLLGERGLMTYEERIESIKRTNEFALNPRLLPKPDDEQIWVSQYKNKSLHFHALPIYDNNKNIGFVIRVDETTRERLAREYLHGLPSDMFSPLEMIRGYSELLLLEKNFADLTNDQREYVSKIKKSSDKLLDLRNSIIDFNHQINT